MATITSRCSVTRVLFDGQSLNQAPAAPNNFPSVVMQPLGVPYRLVSLGGVPWTPDLWASRTIRCFPQANYGQHTILVMTGGTSDLWAGDAAAALYTDMTTYASSARTAGFDRILVSTVCPNSINTGANETQRQAVNTLILANSGGFDGVCDMAAHPNLQNPADTAWYADGTHFTAAGAVAAATTVAPVLNPLII